LEARTGGRKVRKALIYGQNMVSRRPRQSSGKARKSSGNSRTELDKARTELKNAETEIIIVQDRAHKGQGRA
jgi:hypothetical protein